MFKKKKNLSSLKVIKFAGIDFIVRRRNVRYFRVEFSVDRAVITTPYFGNVERFLEENRDKILRKKSQLSERLQKSLDAVLFSRTDKEFRELIFVKLEIYSSELGVKVNDILFRKMKRTMGSCRKNRTLTFNSRLRYMPDKIICYIVYHELLHIKITGGHSKEFRRNIKKRFPDYKILDEIIRQYILKLTIEELL